jgi:hypothetical protein
MCLTQVMGRWTQKQQQRRFQKYFYVFPFLKISLRMAIYKAPDGRLEAVTTKYI